MSMQKKVQRRPIPRGVVLQGLPDFLSRIYLARGVTSVSELDLSLSRLHNNASIKGLDSAVELLVEALLAHQKILILGDFDCDGATSTALAMLFLRELKADCHFLVPNRFEYGYGLTPEIVDLAAHKKPDLIVTVDNGISKTAWYQSVDHRSPFTRRYAAAGRCHCESKSARLYFFEQECCWRWGDILCLEWLESSA